MKTYHYNTLSDREVEKLLLRPKIDFNTIFGTVQPILDEVKKRGDDAIRSYTQKFDGTDLDAVTIDPQKIVIQLEPEIKKAIDRALKNITSFHKNQTTDPLDVETEPGIFCSRVTKPVQRVGLYVPGGTAPLPSTAMMLGVPAMIAGCDTIVMATPPAKDGSIPDSVVYVAQQIGVTTIVKAGGAQAIAGMAFGTESIPKVDKIFGPGNQYVTAAKMILQNSEAMVAIDMPAGPSEVLVIADGNANPEYVAADLLSQAEHGSDSQAVLVATVDFDTENFIRVLNKQLEQLPRKDFATEALSKSYILIVDNTSDAMDFSNQYAPEHLIINTKNAEELSKSVMNAGSVFIGPWTPESMGDYASGTNHTLPTYGYAKMYSGVSLQSFQKFITMQRVTKKGLQSLGPTVETLAELEGLEAHKNAVTVRLNTLNDE
jgi:histidinol dehydrogenase